MKYAVEHFTLGNGWVNTWTEEKDGKNIPLTFDSKVSASIELDEFLDETVEAVTNGNMDAPYDRHDFRIVPIRD